MAVEQILKRSGAAFRKSPARCISQHGLVNVIIHPDYVSSPDRMELYGQLLAYLRERIDRDHGWQALPRDVASWWKAREALQVAGPNGTAHIEGGAHGDYAERATVAWASERDGALTIAP